MLYKGEHAPHRKAVGTSAERGHYGQDGGTPSTRLCHANMAGRPKSHGAERAINQRTKKRHVRNRKAMNLAHEIANAQGIELNHTGTGTLDALQYLLDRTQSLLEWAVSQTDELEPDEFWLIARDAQGNRVWSPHYKFILESELRDQLMDIASKMEGLDIAARRTALAEAQAALIQRFMKLVLDKLELTSTQRELLGPAMREALPLIQGTATSVNPIVEQQPNADAA
jgi:hypothetical protein